MPINLSEISVDADITIMNHIFHGLQGVLDAVNAEAYLSHSIYWGDVVNYSFHSARKPALSTPKANLFPLLHHKIPDTVKEIHVLQLYERYPCFDSEDYANERRVYSNFFFSLGPWLPETINAIANNLPHKTNFQIVTAELPEKFAPAIYYDGRKPVMLLATQSPS